MKPTPTHHTRQSQLLRPLLDTMLVLAVLLALCRAQAATTVSGIIAGETWTKDKSPYVVADDVQVALLTIQPGVEVLLESNRVVEVIGFLTATGSAAEPIVFTRAKTNAGWQGIFFNFTGEGSELTHCRMEGATRSGVRATNAVPVLRSCVFANNSSPTEGGALLVFNEGFAVGQLLMESCLFTNNVSVSHGGGVSIRGGTNSIAISGCSFIGNQADPAYKSVNVFGGGLYVKGRAIIDNGVFRHNAVYARCDTSIATTVPRSRVRPPSPTATSKAVSLARATSTSIRSSRILTISSWSSVRAASTRATRRPTTTTRASRRHSARCAMTWAPGAAPGRAKGLAQLPPTATATACPTPGKPNTSAT